MIKEIKDGVEILKFNKVTMAAVAARSSAKKWGFVILAVPPVANLFLSSMLFPSGFNVMFKTLGFWQSFIPTLALIASIFTMSYVAERFFKSGHNHWAFFKVLAYGSIVLWLTIVPFLLALLIDIDPFGLFMLLSLAGVVWMFVLAYHLFLDWGKMSKHNAALLVGIGFISYLIFQSILGRILVGRYYRMFY